MAVSLLFRRVAPVLAPGLVFVACGARGPLDITVVEGTPLDGGEEAAELDAAPDAADGASEASVRDALTDEGGGPGVDGNPLVDCGTCLAQSCGTQLFTCISDTNCRTALQCVATTCLSGGTFDPTCIGTCTNGDSTALADLSGIFTCVLQNCSSCLGALGGLGGGGGGGSGGSGSSSGGGGGAGGGGNGG